ncbi:response regulator transcription factor [Paenibacillus hodogayensis]|uniref:Response regulator transcription factor n=1 Tax=Paenibacillus hodogayensis TaxID=279208 RepID=A0ABV5W7A3_9BACL
MINVLLVDDQPAVIGFLRNSLNWEALNMRIVGYAANGEEALSLVEQTSPDIVITDIKMPIMDGLGLMQAIRARSLPCKIVVLSAYGEFEYAKQSIQYGVSHYLLKPIDKAKLLDILNRISTEIEHEQDFNQEVTLMKNKIRQFILEEHKRKLIRLLHSRQSGPFAQMALDPQLSQVTEGAFCCMIMECDSPVAPPEPTADGDRTYTLLLHNDRLELVCFYDPGAGVDDGELQRAMIGQYGLPDGSIAGFSNVHTGTDAVVAAYAEAKEAIKGGFYSGSSGNRYCDLAFGKGRSDKNATAAKDKIGAWLRSGQMDSCTAYIREEWTQPFRDQRTSPELVCQSCYELLFLLRSEFGSDAEGTGRLMDELQQIARFCKLEQVQSYLIDQLVGLAARLQSEQAQTDQLVRSVKAYIGVHFRTNISLDLMAGTLFVSKYYLSRMFSKMTGETIWDYLIRYRLDKAKHLLVTSSMKTYEIAAEVGYENTSHFSTLFKKHVGVSPQEYKQANG